MATIFEGIEGQIVKVERNHSVSRAKLSMTTVRAAEKGQFNQFAVVGGTKGNNASSGSYLVDAVVSKINVERGTTSNIAYASDGRVFFHAAADKMGAMSISGMVFANAVDCNGGTRDTKGNLTEYAGNDSLAKLLETYDKLRVSSSNANFVNAVKDLSSSSTLSAKELDNLPQIQVTTAGTSGYTLRGLVHNCRIDTADPAARIFSFNFNTFLLPNP